ncbi:MAG: hypothetical protein JSR37_07160 [Verrucomicrobia bacterium]|nr:hypothetical protein [Verrucomicrobiota bacterium]MBS0637130.1 hypothetical protein [Verrucomicrobiota bacterium]
MQTFQWLCQPKAEEFILKVLTSASEKSHFLRYLEKTLYEKTSTRLLDWVDHIEVGYSDELARELDEAGFTSEIATPLYRVFAHNGAKLPLVVVKDQSHPFVGVALAVESIADFLMCQGLSCWIEGSPYSQFRRSCIAKQQGVFVYVVERRGVLSMEPIVLREGELDKIFLAYEKWQTRSRNQKTDSEEEEGLLQAISLAEEIVESVGQGMGAWIVLDVERRFWQSKNLAGQTQKNRQDHLGLGWANHDHHTFRSSRQNFRYLVRLFEILGFHCRERFYAGAEAGWGAQVMEQKEARLVLFLDVDLSPKEIDGDFAHTTLPEQAELGTIGLWCALHGESILKAGMHHLEAQFDFDKLEHDLTQKGIGVMAPFTKLPHLRQAFTEGERWAVDEERIERLVTKGFITAEQAARFKEHGAIGSHLENLERKQGFKGFNQRSVSDIIHRTDPRGA